MVLLRVMAVLALMLAGFTAGPAGAAGVVSFGRTRIEVVDEAKGNHSMDVELATTPEQLSQGLMGRPSLPADGGMLFDFGGVQPIQMWMKNTLIPLDMVFIAADGRVLGVAERAVPQSLAIIASPGPVRAVLEVNGGAAGRLGLRKGTRVAHPIFQAYR